MNRHVGIWIVSAVVVLGLAALSLVLGTGLLPPRATAQEAGTIVPWFFTWGLITSTALIGVILAGFLIKVAIGPASDE